MKKNDKVIILVLFGIFCTVMTWFVASGAYRDGLFVSNGIYRAGFFDYLLVIYYALYYRASTVIYLFTLGGFYGILCKTNGYRKLVSKTVKLIKDKEIPAMLITTFVVGLYVSFTYEVLAALIVVPFIITVFLKRGKDRLTAFSAAFGGIFIGIFGLTLGTYGVDELLDALQLTVSDGIGFKIAMFVIAYGLYNLFAILHMKSQNEVVNHVKYDLFTTEKLEEKGKKKQKIWPTIVILVITFIVGFIGYINWTKSFSVTLFDDVMADISKVTVKDVTVIKSLLGSIDAFGKWADLLPLSFVLIISSIVLSIVNKVSVGDAFSNFGEGAKKMCKVVLIYILAMSVFVVIYYFPWPLTWTNKLLSSGKFSIFSILLAALLAGVFIVDPEYIGYVFGTFLMATFTDNVIATSLLMHFGYSLSMIVAPTSFVLMMGLAYLDIPYKNWLKYVWKFLSAITIVIVLLVSIIVYV